jgi:hypothetical protein
MHIVLFAKKNTHIEELFDHIASQSMFIWGFHPWGDHWAKIVEQCAIKNRVQYIQCT